MDDFDPESAADISEMTYQHWVVFCRLVAAHSPDRDVSTMAHFNEDGRREIQRLLLGTHVASAFLTGDDPDPPTMRPHPITRPSFGDPPSPSSRFFPSPSALQSGQARRVNPKLPCCFFIFADLSVRKAGEYRLQFTLMRMKGENLRPGETVPNIHTTTSEPFRVVNAKDFDQVHPSTNLVKGLLQRGAGYPLKLKKGIREGQRRRRQQSGDSSTDDSDDDNNSY